MYIYMFSAGEKKRKIFQSQVWGNPFSRSILSKIGIHELFTKMCNFLINWILVDYRSFSFHKWRQVQVHCTGKLSEVVKSPRQDLFLVAEEVESVMLHKSDKVPGTIYLLYVESIFTALFKTCENTQKKSQDVYSHMRDITAGKRKM